MSSPTGDYTPRSPSYHPSDYTTSEDESDEEPQDVRRVVLSCAPDLPVAVPKPNYTPILSSLLTSPAVRPMPIRPMVYSTPVVNSSMGIPAGPIGPTAVIGGTGSVFKPIQLDKEEGEITSTDEEEVDHQVLGSTEAVFGSPSARSIPSASPSPIGNVSHHPVVARWRFTSNCK